MFVFKSYKYISFKKFNKKKHINIYFGFDEKRLI